MRGIPLIGGQRWKSSRVPAQVDSNDPRPPRAPRPRLVYRPRRCDRRYKRETGAVSAGRRAHAHRSNHREWRGSEHDSRTSSSFRALIPTPLFRFSPIITDLAFNRSSAGPSRNVFATSHATGLPSPSPRRQTKASSTTFSVLHLTQIDWQRLKRRRRRLHYDGACGRRRYVPILHMPQATCADPSPRTGIVVALLPPHHQSRARHSIL